jgi:hypothetical protein
MEKNIREVFEIILDNAGMEEVSSKENMRKIT